MAKYLVVTGQAGGFTMTASEVRRFGPGGNMAGFPSSQEGEAELTVRTALTLDNLWTRVLTNALGNATTVRSRVNGADGNMSVSVPATSDGVFVDTVNSESLSSGDRFNGLIEAGADHGNNIVFAAISYVLEDATGTQNFMYCSGGDVVISGDSTNRHGFWGTFNDAVAESVTQYLMRVIGTISDFRVGVGSNGISVASTCFLRINGANGNSSASVPASTDGSFIDTVNTDDIALGDDINTNYAVGASMMGTDTVAIVTHSCLFDSAGYIVACETYPTFTNIQNSQTMFFVVNDLSNNGGSTTESDSQITARFDFDAVNYYARVANNSLNAATTLGLRKNGSTSALSVSVPASTDGEFEDTVNVVSYVPADTINQMADTTASTSGTIEPFFMGFQLNQPPILRGMPQLLPRAARRAAPNSYWIDNLLAVEVSVPTEFPPIRPMLQLHPRAAPRAAPNSYWQDNLLAVPELEFPPIQPMLQLHPRAAPRAGPNSYWIDNLLVVEEQVFPPIRPMAQLHPRTAPRAAPLSYWIDNKLAVEERVFPPIRPMAQLHPRAALRAAPLAYWIDNLLAVEEFPPIQPMPQLHPRAAARAAPLSYWIDNLLAVEELPEVPPIRPMPQLHPRAALRGSPLLYWIDNLLVVEEFPPVRPMPQLNPRAALRGSPLLYWIPNELATESFPPIQSMPQLHPRAALRGSPLLYWIDNLLVVPEIAAVTIEVTYVIDAIIGSPAIGFQPKQFIVKRISVKVLQLKDLIGPE